MCMGLPVVVVKKCASMHYISDLTGIGNRSLINIDESLREYSFHNARKRSCGAVYCNRSCRFVGVCLWVCYHDNSKLRASILTKMGLYFVGKGSDHLQLIKFWPSRAHGKVCGGAKFLAPPYYSQRAVFASPPSAFYSYLMGIEALCVRPYSALLCLGGGCLTTRPGVHWKSGGGRLGHVV